MARRAIGIAMLCVEVALLRLTMGYMGYGIGIILLALLGCLPKLRRTWSFRARAATMGAIAGGFYLLLLLDAFDSDALRAQFVEEPGSLAWALCFIVLQAVQYYWRSPRGLPDYYPLLGGISLASSADRYLRVLIEINLPSSFAGVAGSSTHL